MEVLWEREWGKARESFDKEWFQKGEGGVTIYCIINLFMYISCNKGWNLVAYLCDLDIMGKTQDL